MRAWGRGFSVLDVLVSVAVIAVLLSLLLPGLAAVRETARRVVCASNVRQSGLGLAMYSDDHRGVLPPTRFSSTTNQLHRMTVVRMPQTAAPWDGLGNLYAEDYLNVPDVFYCPSHQGTYPLQTQRLLWNSQEKVFIVSNYHFRGAETNGNRVVWRMRPEMTLVSDGLSSPSAFNHVEGCNVLQAGLSVRWLNDPSTQVMPMLPSDSDAQAVASGKVGTVWSMLDGWTGDGPGVLASQPTTPYHTPGQTR